jgi:hypothetical protein
MGPTYRKTTLGLTEIGTRALRLAPKPRGVLILVDGRRSREDLYALLGYDPSSLLQELLSHGLIELVAAEPEARQKPAATPSAAPVDAPKAPAPAPAPAAAAEPLPLAARRAAAVRALNDALGPSAESLAIRMEKAQTEADLQALLERAASLVNAVRGPGAARDFLARHGV